MLFLFLTQIVFAEPISLKQALDLAERQNQELRAQSFQIDQARFDEDRVGGEFGPKLDALLGVGPNSRATGNALQSSSDTNHWGRTFLGKFVLTQPLYTFGRQGNYADAARAGVAVERAEYSGKVSEIRYQVKEAYYGYQLANSLRDFIEGGKAELLKALEKRKKNAESKDGFRLEIFLAEVESREAEVKKYFELARAGLALRIGQSAEQLAIKDPWLVPEERKLEPFEFYWRQAQENRGEFQQLREGILAKTSLARAEKKALWPALVALASYEFADTNVRPEQPSLFANDPYNRSALALGVGLKMDFQWSLAQAKAGKLLAEASELEAKQSFAQQGIQTELKKAYFEVEEASTRLKAAKTAYAVGKKWLTKEVIGYASGLAGTSGLVEAYGARAETAKTYFEAVHRHHLAWATLAKVVGKEIDPIMAR
jgi:outer membrane protein TolC